MSQEFKINLFVVLQTIYVHYKHYSFQLRAITFILVWHYSGLLNVNIRLISYANYFRGYFKYVYLKISKLKIERSELYKKKIDKILRYNYINVKMIKIL